jgi:hypothetical protein
MTADQLSFLTGRGLCAFQRRGGGGCAYSVAHTLGWGAGPAASAASGRTL